MGKRRKPLTPHEQLLLRQAMVDMVAQHPEWAVPKMLKEIRKTLHLTTHDIARVGRIFRACVAQSGVKAQQHFAEYR